MEKRLLNIDESHMLYVVTRIKYLLNNKIREDKNEATIFVESTFIKEQLTKKRQLLVDALEKQINIVVDETLAKETKSLKVKKGMATGILPNPDYVSTPYFVSKGNEAAYKIVQLSLQGKAKGIIFISGNSGTGKSHLLHLMAHEAIGGGYSVYLNSSYSFIEKLKEHFAKKETGFASMYARNNFFILDDFQIFNKDFTAGYQDALFEIMNNLMLNGRNIVFSSDIRIGSFTLLPERILSRLNTSYAPELEFPDTELKRKFLEYYAKKIEIEDMLTEETIEGIVHFSKTLRDVMGASHMCRLLSLDGEFQVWELLNRLKAAGGFVEGNAFNSISTILYEHYGVSDPEVKLKSGQFRPRNLGKANSVLYYLFHEKMDLKVLRNKLQIVGKKHAYNIQYGEKNYKEITDKYLKNKIETLIKEKEKELKTLSMLSEGKGEEANYH